MQLTFRTAAAAALFLCTALLGGANAPGYASEAVVASVSTPNVPAAPVVPAVAVEATAAAATVAPAASAATVAAAGTSAAASVTTPVFASLSAAVAAQPVEVADDEIACLATGVLFESKGEPLDGQLAVAEVILNRAESGRFPKSACAVLKQPGQFSFVRGGQLPSVNEGSHAWRTAVKIAHIARQGLWESKAADALFFHARRLSPRWGKTRVATLGNHVFYN